MNAGEARVASPRHTHNRAGRTPRACAGPQRRHSSKSSVVTPRRTLKYSRPRQTTPARRGRRCVRSAKYPPSARGNRRLLLRVQVLDSVRITRRCLLLCAPAIAKNNWSEKAWHNNERRGGQASLSCASPCPSRIFRPPARSGVRAYRHSPKSPIVHEKRTMGSRSM